jgi:hypothetical protein
MFMINEMIIAHGINVQAAMEAGYSGIVNTSLRLPVRAGH